MGQQQISGQTVTVQFGGYGLKGNSRKASVRVVTNSERYEGRARRNNLQPQIFEQREQVSIRTGIRIRTSAGRNNYFIRDVCPVYKERTILLLLQRIHRAVCVEFPAVFFA